MPLITSSLKTMRIHSRPPAEFLSAIRAARLDFVVFEIDDPDLRYLFSGVVFDTNSYDVGEQEGDVKITYDETFNADELADLVKVSPTDKALIDYLSEITRLFSVDEPDYVFLCPESAHVDWPPSDVEQQPLGMVFPPDYTPSQNAFYEIDNDAADGDEE